MMDAPLSDGLVEAAADWYLRRQDAGWTNADEREFDAWTRADPRHAQVYRQLSRTWADFSHVSRPDSVPAAPASAPTSTQPACAGSRVRRHERPRFGTALSWRPLAAALCTFCLFLAGAWYAYDHTPRYRVDLSTARGEIRVVSLPDSSRITLNAASRLQIAYYPRRRQVVLERGEAFFEVARDPSRPFTVAAGENAVRVLGTVFDVRAQPSSFQVEVVEGRVEVQPGKDATGVVLTAQQGLRMDAGGRPQALRPDAQAIGAWRSGQLVFRRTPLPDAAQELSRHLGAPVTLSGPGLGGLTVSGFASIGAPQAFLESLPDVIPVRVSKQGTAGYVVTAR